MIAYGQVTGQATGAWGTDICRGGMAASGKENPYLLVPCHYYHYSSHTELPVKFDPLNLTASAVHNFHLTCDVHNVGVKSS